MKKVLFVTLALAIGMTGFAQIKNQPVKASQTKDRYISGPKLAYKGINDAPIMNFAPTQATPVNPNKEDEILDFQTMMTNYDLQSNGFVADRMYRFEDGTVGVVATWSQLANSSDRGTGYNYFNGTGMLFDFDENPVSARVESERTGWPVYTQYGANGEIIVAHYANGLTYYTRENKGEGEWSGHYIPNPDPEELGVPTATLTWPKVATSGDNHEILHVLACDQDDDTKESYCFYSRSTDGENWVTTCIPTLEEWEHIRYSSDFYAIAANGNTVAILLLGNAYRHGYVIKSDDNGETWKQIKYWNNPIAELDWANDENSLVDKEDAIYAPETGAICIDNDGIVHCAFSAFEFYRPELSETGYYISYGKSIDGIFYWNETMGTVQGPEWTCPDDGYVIPASDHNAFRLWWPTGEDSDYIRMNIIDTHAVGFLPNYSDTEMDYIYYEDDYTDYWYGVSVLPSICVDESGAIAIGYSCPDIERTSNDGMYLRSIYVSYLEAPYHMGDHYGEFTEEVGDVYYIMARLQDADDFLHSYDEAVALCSPQNTTNLEFWYSYQADDTPGFYIGNSALQSGATENYIWATMLKPDLEGFEVNEQATAMNTQMEIYPNPVVNQLNVRLENEAEISVYNIMGQNVLNMQGVKGVNTINTSDLTSGVYFISAGTVTQKFIVK